MKNDIFESVSQRGGKEKDSENGRIVEIANELRRGCELYESELRKSQKDVSQLDIEQRVAEHYAKEHGLWISIDEICKLGIPGPTGNENDTYVSNDIIYKVNNLMNSRSILILLDKILWHNNLFVETAYDLYGFTGLDGRTVMPVLKQQLVKNAVPATPIEIETYMAALGFCKTEKDGCFESKQYKLWDLFPRNVLKDNDGDIFIVDAEIQKVLK